MNAITAPVIDAPPSLPSAAQAQAVPFHFGISFVAQDKPASVSDPPPPASSGHAAAAIVHVSGQGISHDPGIALETARADAIAQCNAQGGTPVVEVYNHLTRANQWIASSIWSCEVPDAQ